jgi:DNA modification methylase
MRVEKIGLATLYLGDCLDVLPTLEAVDSVVADPPYEILNKFGTSDFDGTRRMEFHFDTEGITDAVVIPALSLAFGIAQSFHVFCSCEQYAGIAAAARGAGMTPKPFAKVKLCPPVAMPGNWWPSGFELAMYGYKPGAWFGDTDTKRCNVVVADSYRNGIRSKEKCDHPTQKWLPMMEKIVASIVKPGGVALDPFMGSGTTGVAAVSLGRRFVGIEIEPRYFDMACQRVEDAQRQAAMFGA